MDFGERLAVIRGRAHLSQDGLARAAGVSRQTVYNLETAPGWKIRPSTALLIGQCLVERGAMTRDEIYWYARETGIRVENLLQIQTMVGTAPDPVRGELYAILDALIDREGQEFVRGALEAIRASRPAAPTTPADPAASAAPADPRTLTVHHPPRQRAGHFEEVEVDYSVPSARKPRQAKTRKTRRQA